MSAAPSVLFITRKYPPALGGMEEFSAQLYSAYPGPKQLVALRRGQRWLPAFCIGGLATARGKRGQFAAIHLGDGLLALLAPAIERLSGAPAFVTIHGQEVTRDLPGYRTALRRSLKRLGTRVIAVSSFTAHAAATRHGVRSVEVIPNGVNTGRFGRIERQAGDQPARASLGLPPNGKLVVTVGRLVRRKGALWFAAEVLPLLPPDVVYVVAGDGPDLVALRRAAALDDRIHLLGRASDATVDALYGLADLFVAPNIAVEGSPEGYGVAPAEAACAGLPVLVSAIDGLVDMAAEVGIPTVPWGDAQAWARAVTLALADPPAALAARPARSWSAVAQDYARYFEGFCAPSPRR
ncbi:MAG: glycosyltransferase family 4 protein [Dehalococcoidia bacterium]